MSAQVAQSSPPSHGRGTAAEQGARIRAQMQEKRRSQLNDAGADSQKRHSQSHTHRPDKEARRAKEKEEEARKKFQEEERRKSAADETQREADERAARREKANAKEEKKKAAALEKQKVEDEKTAMKEKDQVTAEERNAPDAQRGTSAKDPEKLAAAAAAAAAAGGAGATAVAIKGRQSKPKLGPKGRCYPVSGIDNLALLMEGDAYQTTCFSIYMFRSELDSEIVHKFFDKLTSSFPKYRFVVELSPSEAAKKEKVRKAAATKGEVVSSKSPTEQEKKGRRTSYSKTIKAGGFFRPARWRFDESFHFQDNIVELDGCPNGGQDEASLFDLAGDFLSEHFDYSKPLWKAMCVRGINTSEGAKSALMIKVHHSLSDGQGMIMSYHAALAALEHDAPIETVQAQADSRTRTGEQKKPGQRNIQPTLWGTTKHGFHTVRGLYFGRRQAFEYKESPRVSTRFYCHSDGIPMADINLVRDVFSSSGLDLSLNDVACAVLSRALRIAAERTTTGKVKDKRVAIFVPISLRPAKNWELANYTTGGIAWFRFHDPTSVPYREQLAQVNREMNRIKRSYWPRVWYNMFGFISKKRAWFMPNYPIGKQFFERTYREYHVATNLPGPSKPVKFGSHEAYSYHVLPPSSPGKSSLSIGMISYANDFSLAVSCDGVKEFEQNKLAQEICRAFQDSAKELVEAAKEEQRSSGKAATEKSK